MQPLMNAMVFLLDFVVSAYLYLLIMRILMQKYRVSWHNPLSQFIIKVSDPIVKPLRRLMPGVAGIDLSIVCLVFIIQCAELWALELLSGMPSLALTGFLIVSLSLCLTKLLNLYFFMVILVAVMSWFATERPNPMAAVFVTIIQPLMQRIQRLMPVIAGFDLSPIVLIIIIQLVKIVLLNPLQGLGVAMSF